MSLLVATNLFQFKNIDSKNNKNYQALSAYETNNIINIALSGSPTVQKLWGPWIELGRVAPYSTLLVSSEVNKTLSMEDIENRYFSFSKGERMKPINLLNSELPAQVKVWDSIVASGGGKGRGSMPYLIALMDKKNYSRTADEKKHSSEKPELLLIKWNGELNKSHIQNRVIEDYRGPYLLFIDTKLLPYDYLDRLNDVN